MTILTLTPVPVKLMHGWLGQASSVLASKPQGTTELPCLLYLLCHNLNHTNREDRCPYALQPDVA